ncbi:MAG: hypothetical protein KAT04_05310 [Methylococcales bacterium]|nr:hypothetical protein [Candidatus Moranbacteria bacterium]MCK4841286.1 hypothetical protein [Methylococcales bacterium]
MIPEISEIKDKDIFYSSLKKEVLIVKTVEIADENHAGFFYTAIYHSSEESTEVIIRERCWFSTAQYNTRFRKEHLKITTLDEIYLLPLQNATKQALQQ